MSRLRRSVLAAALCDAKVAVPSGIPKECLGSNLDSDASPLSQHPRHVISWSQEDQVHCVQEEEAKMSI